jgi:hypothetical protein
MYHLELTPKSYELREYVRDMKDSAIFVLWSGIIRRGTFLLMNESFFFYEGIYNGFVISIILGNGVNGVEFKGKVFRR